MSIVIVIKYYKNTQDKSEVLVRDIKSKEIRIEKREAANNEE